MILSFYGTKITHMPSEKRIEIYVKLRLSITICQRLLSQKEGFILSTKVMGCKITRFKKKRAY